MTTRPGLQNLATPLGTAPLMLHLGTIFRSVLSLTLHPFLPPGMEAPLSHKQEDVLATDRSAESAGHTQMNVVLSVSRMAVCSV